MQKNFLIRASIKKLLTKYQIFTILPQISHFHKFCNFSSIFATFETNCFIPINFMEGTCQKYSFFIFASCELLTFILSDCIHFRNFKVMKLTELSLCLVYTPTLNTRCRWRQNAHLIRTETLGAIGRRYKAVEHLKLVIDINV